MSYHILTLGSFAGLFTGCFLAGGFASMFGVGGGFVLVPLLTVFFGVPIHTAIATSLLCIVGTSQSVALARASNRFTDVRLGLPLEASTIVGAIIGGLIATSTGERTLKMIFGFSLAVIVVFMIRKSFKRASNGACDTDDDNYEPKNMSLGICASTAAGILSTILGIGGGIVKVPVLRLLMNVPFRAAVATSNFMIGLTAATGAVFYLSRGFIDPGIIFPCVLGIVAGAFLGGNVGPRIKSAILERIFLLIVAYLALKMISAGLDGF